MGQELVWAILKKEKPSAIAGIQTPDRPARSLISVPTALSQLLKRDTDKVFGNSDSICCCSVVILQTAQCEATYSVCVIRALECVS